MVAVFFEGQIKQVPDTPRYNPEEEDLERGRAAMAAFPNQENASCEQMQKKKLERGAHRNGRFPRSSRWTGRKGE